MPDVVYRRAVIARFNAMINLPLAVAIGVGLVLAGVSINLLSLVIYVIGVIVLAPFLFGRAASKESDDGRLASAEATRAKLTRYNARWTIPSVAAVIAIAAVSGDWFLAPGTYFMVAFGGLVEWQRLERWERDHPGEYQVTTMGRWIGRRSVLVAG